MLSFSVLLFGGCSTDYVIPQADMEKIYHDMYLVDKYISDIPDFMMQADSMSVYEPVLEKYGYTKEDFLEALGQYLHNPEDLTEILKNTKAGMELEMTAIAAQIDSLQDGGGSGDFRSAPQTEEKTFKKMQLEEQWEGEVEVEVEVEVDGVTPEQESPAMKVQKLDPKELKKKKRIQ